MQMNPIDIHQTAPKIKRCRLSVYFYSQQPQHEQKVASRMGNVEKKSGPRYH
jgi:hypothetical protein